MENIFKSNVLWSQIDANMHLRHSAYADFAAQARVELLNQCGLDYKTFSSLKIGPILFREELIYFREVGLNESISIETFVTKSNADMSRWSFTQHMYRSDGVKAATIHVDGAWMDVVKRKLTVLPEEFIQRLNELPKSEDFQQV
ncbi:thioesterase family protein [Cytophagaceae bacterium YF14B1]|uniref:Thioesterase family protein n=1 Tax=Xanthocytophaga flava TaxID=3048013 RepID=A0AAE3QMY5_9BACT|nr:thioesterase family protein [Xanthocytophaga flavus]MDJ1479588.1 thioesterase family protein [Xanthocytophaga flavus]